MTALEGEGDGRLVTKQEGRARGAERIANREGEGDGDGEGLAGSPVLLEAHPVSDAGHARLRALSVLASALALSLTAHAQRRSPAHPQPPRVIHLESFGCPIGRPYVPFDWVVAPPGPCDGALLAAACGAEAPVAGTCPTVSEVASQLGADALASCTPSAALLPAAEALYQDPAQLAAAYVPYRRLADVAALRTLALYRAGRAAIRLSRYANAIDALGTFLGSGPTPAALRETAARYLVAEVLAYDDLDENGVPDEDFPEARLRTPFLPDAPWARALAIATVRELDVQQRTSDGARARAAVRARWPDVTDADFAPLPVLDHGDGGFDVGALRSHPLHIETLAPCAPSTGAVLSVRVTIAMGGTVPHAEVTPPGPTATCVAAAIERLHVTPPEGGVVMREGVVVYAPRVP